MELNRVAVFALSLLAAGTVRAGNLQCGQNDVTDAMVCFDPAELRERDGIRMAPMYQGGPNGVRKKPFTIHVNCRSQVVHLKDRDGVSFGGGKATDTDLLRQLTNAMCSAKLPAAPPPKR